jgi:nicotinate-nucleotide adenylyltransferase
VSIRLGLLGGTFDPIHFGHLDVAEAARRALGLDLVWVMPARVPPHRRPPQASAAHRFAMAALASQDCDDLLVSDFEIDTPGPSYSVDTLDRLARTGWRPESLFFITGADAFREIESWKAYPEVLARCHFVVVSRSGEAASAMRARLPVLASRMKDAPAAPGAEPGIYLVDAPTRPVSSTDVRACAAAGRPLTALVPPAVEAYIVRQGLYSTASPGPKEPA